MEFSWIFVYLQVSVRQIWDAKQLLALSLPTAEYTNSFVVGVAMSKTSII